MALAGRAMQGGVRQWKLQTCARTDATVSSPTISQHIALHSAPLTWSALAAYYTSPKSPGGAALASQPDRGNYCKGHCSILEKSGSNSTHAARDVRFLFVHSAQLAVFQRPDVDVAASVASWSGLFLSRTAREGAACAGREREERRASGSRATRRTEHFLTRVRDRSEAGQRAI